MQSVAVQWSELIQKDLGAQLVGFWAEDVWDS